MFNPADNLESSYAKDALIRRLRLLYEGKRDAVSPGKFEKVSGFTVSAKDGSMREDLPPIQRWLNRIFAFPILLQNTIFDEYLGLVEARIDAARRPGTLDLGVETILVEKFKIISEQLLFMDPASGATTNLLEIEMARKLNPICFQALSRLHELAMSNAKTVRNTRFRRVLD